MVDMHSKQLIDFGLNIFVNASSIDSTFNQRGSRTAFATEDFWILVNLRFSGFIDARGEVFLPVRRSKFSPYLLAKTIKSALLLECVVEIVNRYAFVSSNRELGELKTRADDGRRRCRQSRDNCVRHIMCFDDRHSEDKIEDMCCRWSKIIMSLTIICTAKEFATIARKLGSAKPSLGGTSTISFQREYTTSRPKYT